MPAYPSLDPRTQSDFLQELVGRARTLAAVSDGPRPVAVFDLDGTLMDNRPRSAAIFRELADRWVERHPEEAKKIRDAKPDELAYAISDSLTRLGVQHPDLVEEAGEFWRQRFFHDAYLVHDVPTPGAASFVHALYEAGANIVYLTGRDLPLMGLGSWMSLRDLGFPIGVVGTELVCKPEASMNDETFKHDVAPTLRRLGEVFASFDNEPGNCNLFARVYPRCASVLLDTQHASGAPPLVPEIISIRDFERKG
jgi:hypothetical protein